MKRLKNQRVPNQFSSKSWMRTNHSLPQRSRAKSNRNMSIRIQTITRTGYLVIETSTSIYRGSSHGYTICQCVQVISPTTGKFIWSDSKSSWFDLRMVTTRVACLVLEIVPIVPIRDTCIEAVWSLPAGCGPRWVPGHWQFWFWNNLMYERSWFKSNDSLRLLEHLETRRSAYFVWWTTKVVDEKCSTPWWTSQDYPIGNKIHLNQIINC
jgi:hypothetical protein